LKLESLEKQMSCSTSSMGQALACLLACLLLGFGGEDGLGQVGRNIGWQ